MKVTTVRFSEDLWATVAAEAEIAGVSASQFIREAALARAASAAGSRGEVPFPSLAQTISEVEGMARTTSDDAAVQKALAALSRALANSFRGDAHALRAQSRQARRTARSLVDQHTTLPPD